MGIYKKIFTSLMIVLILLCRGGAFFCASHDCCRIAHENEHICCHCDEHADECSSHNVVINHRCNDSEPFVSEEVFFAQQIAAINVSTSYQTPFAKTISHKELWRCEIPIDHYTPSAGLLRAPPALV